MAWLAVCPHDIQQIHGWWWHSCLQKHPYPAGRHHSVQCLCHRHLDMMYMPEALLNGQQCTPHVLAGQDTPLLFVYCCPEWNCIGRMLCRVTSKQSSTVEFTGDISNIEIATNVDVSIWVQLKSLPRHAPLTSAPSLNSVTLSFIALFTSTAGSALRHSGQGQPTWGLLPGDEGVPLKVVCRQEFGVQVRV